MLCMVCNVFHTIYISNYDVLLHFLVACLQEVGSALLYKLNWKFGCKLRCDSVCRLDKQGRYKAGWHIVDKSDFSVQVLVVSLRVSFYRNRICRLFYRFGNVLVFLHSRGIGNCFVLSGFWVVHSLEVA